MQAESKSTAGQFRAGGMILSLFAAPLSVHILRAHEDGPLRLPALREKIGGGAQTTLRGQVGNLRGIGALAKRERGGMPRAVENELTDTGRAMLEVADVLEAWLAQAPQGSIALGSEPAKGAIKALVGGWNSTMLRALAAHPLSLTELDGLIGDLSYPALERRLSGMRAARQVEALPGQGKSTPYTVTDWLRRAVAPLLAAGRCECRHIETETPPPIRIDIETAFLLAVPLVGLSGDLSGHFTLAVDTGAGELEKGERLAGVRVEVEKGEIGDCVSRLEQDPRTWALGTVDAWIDAIVDRRPDRLRIGGTEAALARDLVVALHDALFRA
jgi:DNA-binding HxlR family transcriptional regulator